jgi:AcrR family transcriptional regulator
VEAATTNQSVPANRLDRRKARTRQALVDAAVRLIAEGRGERASIQEITEAADIGFGSFYNHFVSRRSSSRPRRRRCSSAGRR